MLAKLKYFTWREIKHCGLNWPLKWHNHRACPIQIFSTVLVYYVVKCEWRYWTFKSFGELFLNFTAECTLYEWELIHKVLG